MTDSLIETIRSLEEDIVFGRRRPRERLVEDELVTQFGAKKHIVRQALVELERMGLVERKRNKGATVRDYRPEDARQIFSVRTLLEAEAARLIPLPAPAEVISALEDVQLEHSAAVEAGDTAKAFRANIRFHQKLFQACGNPYLAETINAFAFKSHGIRSYSAASPPLLRSARDEHLRMIEALRQGNCDQLIALCISHLQPPLRAYIDAYEQIFGHELRRVAEGV